MSSSPTPTVAETGAPPPHRRMRPRGPARPPRLRNDRIMQLMRNGAWLLLPIGIPELCLRPALPTARTGFVPALPVDLIDGVLQVLVYGGALLLHVSTDERPGRVGIALYAVGVTATVSSWVVGVVGAPRAPGLDCPAGLGVTVAPLLCFVGMGLLGRSGLYAGIGLALTLVRLFSTLPPGLCA